ncbi:MAG TPA: CvpA family protein, partial [Microthrixaceae bacterium]|nr:CvpA family protein [Microthrixaceae bacterium]
MNELDLIFLLGALVAGLGGWRFGFVRRVIGWIGLVIGVVVASKLLPVVFPTPETPEPADLIRSLVVILGAGLIGQAVGHVVGGRMKGMLDIARFGLIDSAGGAVLGVAGVVITAWMF